MPRNVTILNIGTDYINISWMNPSNIGCEVVLGQFIIEAISNTSNTTVYITANNDPSYTNILSIEGLKPVTDYNIIIQGISVVDELGLVFGEPNEMLSITTVTGGKHYYSF